MLPSCRLAPACPQGCGAGRGQPPLGVHGAPGSPPPHLHPHGPRGVPNTAPAAWGWAFLTALFTHRFWHRSFQLLQVNHEAQLTVVAGSSWFKVSSSVWPRVSGHILWGCWGWMRDLHPPGVGFSRSWGCLWMQLTIALCCCFTEQMGHCREHRHPGSPGSFQLHKATACTCSNSLDFRQGHKLVTVIS